MRKSSEGLARKRIDATKRFKKFLLPPVLADQIGPIGDQAAARDKEAMGIDDGKAMPRRKPGDRLAMKLPLRADHRDQAAMKCARTPRWRFFQCHAAA